MTAATQKGSLGPVVLLTRPAGLAESMIDRVRSLGISVHNEPVLDIEPIAVSSDWLEGAAALCVSSPSGADRLAALPSIPRNLPVFAVGPSTAKRLELSGFSNVEFSDGTGTGLVSLVHQRAPLNAGTFVHASGEHISCDIAANLAALGFQTRRVVVYSARLQHSFTYATRQLIEAGRVRAVICLSRRTAATLSILLRKHGLFNYAMSATAIAMSSQIAEQMVGDGWPHVHVAATPSSESALASLQLLSERRGVFEGV